MSVKLIIYFIHDDRARNTVREGIHALTTGSNGEDKVIEISGSTYAVATKKTAAEVMEKIRLVAGTEVKGAYRIHVVEVTSSANVVSIGDSTAKSDGAWLNAIKMK